MSQVCIAVLLVVLCSLKRNRDLEFSHAKRIVFGIGYFDQTNSWFCIISPPYFPWAHKLLSFLRSTWILDHTKKAEVYRIRFTFLFFEFFEPDISLFLRSFIDHRNLHNNFRSVLLLSYFRDVERPQLISNSTPHLISFLVDIIHIY